jgi:hypothetical protein
MRTTQDYELQANYGASALSDDARGAGWVGFAAILLGFTGMWNCFEGILAIASSRVYVAHQTFIFSDLNTWGWIVTVLGVIQVFAALALLTGSEFARWFGIASASLNAIGQLMFVPAYPWWSLAMFSADMLIIYALAVYGGHRLREAL